MRINQLIPVLHRNDAIGESVLLYRKFVNQLGIESEIYALQSDCDAETEVKPLGELPDDPSDINLLHYALPSVVTSKFLSLRGKRVLVFHNITPSRYFRTIDQSFYKTIDLGYKELKEIRDHLDLTIADSTYNKESLRRFGYDNCIVFPVFVNFERLEKPLKKAVIRHLGDYLNILVLGRIAPNKKIEDAIRVFNLIKLKYYPNSRLWVVGKKEDHRYYYNALIRLGSAWGLNDMIFTGKVTERELASYLRGCTALLSMSEHEGFCVPVLEGFYTQLPVIAYNAGAVAETMGKGGIIFDSKEYEYIAELLLKIKSDEDFRKSIIINQNERLEYFSMGSQENRAKEITEILKAL